MKTEISKFCEECLQQLSALPPALEKATADLELGSEKQLLEKPLRLLNDIRARSRSLMEKLASQQAYLLIFGPLKSGKSTLMNAISGAYVSEVTSLPGYPCLVFVRNATEPHFSVTRYNGRETVFANGTALKDVMEDSHLALAAQIRAAELRGDDFDPRTHFTEAIRRVDVKLPVHNLGESSTVLVDTPGLYSRMNFGYDVLTREFRDSAACAVFVAKTDNLFLEQVFTEFNQLLGLFSRIFLVINVDSSKRDLHADGSLQPSAESRDPEQIIEAFKTLSMAGPLRRAYDENRVRIHAIDLLSAASSFLSGRGNGNSDATANDENGNGSHQQAMPPDANQKTAFEGFVRDLTDYLNSSDYTVEFIRDSLRQGGALCTEAREILGSHEIETLRACQSELESELREIDDRVAAVDRLLAVDWKIAFEKVSAENATLGQGKCPERQPAASQRNARNARCLVWNQVRVCRRSNVIDGILCSRRPRAR
jgi:energy-coupling factor transporter ATP-binding protein EcfA2